jgi:hypothetical protein
MFGIEKKNVLEVGTTIIPVIKKSPTPTPISIEAELAEEEHKEYVQISEELGFRPAALIKDELLAFLSKRDLKVYVYGEVKQYLDQKFGRKIEREASWRHTWGWCPLREVDMEKSDLVAYNNRDAYIVDNGEFTFNRTYHGAIPFSVLWLVKEISKSIQGLYFFVSDAKQPQDRVNRDPFLAVSAPGMAEIIVIAEWNEPSFHAKHI